MAVKFNDLEIPTPIELLDRDTPGIPYVVEPWLIKGSYSILTAQPGRMKSYFALYLAKLWLQRKDTHVLYLDRENSEATILPRLHQLKIPRTSRFQYWADWPSSPCGPPPATINHPHVLEGIGQKKNLLIVFDNMDKFFPVSDENSNVLMKPMGSQVRQLTHLGATVLVLHQNTKEDPKTGVSRYRGASQIIADVEVAYDMFLLENVGGTMEQPQNLIGIKCIKTRFTGIFKRYLVFDPPLGDFVMLPEETTHGNCRQRAKEYFSRSERIAKIKPRIHELLIDKGHMNINAIQSNLNVGIDVGDDGRVSVEAERDCLEVGKGKLWKVEVVGSSKHYHPL